MQNVMNLFLKHCDHSENKLSFGTLIGVPSNIRLYEKASENIRTNGFWRLYFSLADIHHELRFTITT